MSSGAGQLLESKEEGTILLPTKAEPRAGKCHLLVSLDYDGTLRIEGEEHVEAGFFGLMHTLHEQGVRWGINTGRSLRKLEAELASFPIMPDFICTCERYAYLADERGYLLPATEYNARCHQENLALRAKVLPAWQRALQKLRRTCPDCQWELAIDDPLSIEAKDSQTMDRLMPHLLSFANTEVGIQRAGRFMRLCDARFSKGSALQYIQQTWQVEETHMLLMGDGHNDIDAFRHFPRAYCAAPAAAHPDVHAWLQANGGHISPAPGVLHTLQDWARQWGLRIGC